MAIGERGVRRPGINAQLRVAGIAVTIIWSRVYADVREALGFRFDHKMCLGAVANASISGLTMSARRAWGPERTLTWPDLRSTARTPVAGDAAVRPMRSESHFKVTAAPEIRYVLPSYLKLKRARRPTLILSPTFRNSACGCVVVGVVLVGVVDVGVVGVVAVGDVVSGGVGVLGSGFVSRCPSRITTTWAGMFGIGMCVVQAAITLQLSVRTGAAVYARSSLHPHLS